MGARTPGLLDRFEHKGQWWVPSRPSHRVGGTLSYDPMDGLHLDLLGNISPVSQVWASKRSEIGVIHGDTTTGQPATLHRSFCTNFRLDFKGTSTERLYSRTALIGAHVADPETATFPSCAFRFTSLEEWLSAQPISVKNVSLLAPREFDVAYRPPAETTYVLDQIGAQLRTASSFETQDETPRHFGITARSWLVLTPDIPRPLVWYRDAVAKLRNLVALCFAAPVYVEGVRLFGDEAPAGGDRLRADLAYLQSPAPPSLEPWRPERGLGLAEFSEAGGDLNTWFRMYNVIKPALNLFFAVLFGRSLYIDVRFLLLAQALETLHRSLHGSLYTDPAKYDEIRAQVEDAIPADAPDKLRGKITGSLKTGNEYSFRDRLADLSSGPLAKMGVAKMNSSKRHKIAETRNYYTHYSAKLRDTAAHGGELHDLIRLMTAAMTAILFDRLGVAPERVRRC